MINKTDLHKYCGYFSCVQLCSKHCISLEENFEGFLYPKVDIDSGLCGKVCSWKDSLNQIFPM